MNKNSILSYLTNVLEKDNVLFDDDSKYMYGMDLTKDYKPNPLAIVFPRNDQDIIEIVNLANEIGIGLVPSGGRTGYSGGAVAANGEIVVSFAKMNRIIDFNLGDRNIRCEAGVTTKTVQDFALKNNLYYPIDFASTAKCQIGGNIATNAGGIKVIRYGLTRNWISGLKVVTGKGETLEFNHGLTKNATGYDFRHLFIGSEGTLGFITEATLKLTSFPTDTKVILLSVPDCSHLIEILNLFREKLQINAFEFFSDKALQYMLNESKLNHPFSKTTSYYALLEYESGKGHDEFANNILTKCKNKGIIEDALISNDAYQAKQFWRYRIEISMSLLKYFPHKYDIALLPSNIANFMQEGNNLLGKTFSAIEVIWFGHIGDGNLHLNLLKPSHFSNEEFISLCTEINLNVYNLIQKYQGTISAEHGIGLTKKNYLTYSKNQVEVNYMKNIKKIFDPNNIMNPGKLI